MKKAESTISSPTERTASIPLDVLSNAAAQYNVQLSVETINGYVYEGQLTNCDAQTMTVTLSSASMYSRRCRRKEPGLYLSASPQSAPPVASSFSDALMIPSTPQDLLGRAVTIPGDQIVLMVLPNALLSDYTAVAKEARKKGRKPSRPKRRASEL